MTRSEKKSPSIAGFQNAFHRLKRRLTRGLSAAWSAARRNRTGKAPEPPPEAVSAALTDCQEALVAACQNSEADFLRLGKDLETIHADVKDLVAETLATIRRTAGDDHESVLMTIDGLVRKSLDDLNGRRREVAARLDHIDAIIDQLKGLDRLCSAMERLTMNLRVVGFNIRVESARSTDSQDMFGVVSEQINRLSDHVDQNAERFREDVRDAADRQLAAHDGISRSLDRLDGLASGAARAVKGSAKDIEKLMAGSLSAVKEAETHLKAISREVGEVVAGIQIHDSMSQRITHINKALDDAAALCTPHSSELIRYGDVEDRRFTAAHSIIELQIAQLQRIISDIETGHRDTQRAFDRIGTEIEGLADSLLGLKAGMPAASSGAAADHDPFDALRNDLFGFHALLTEASELVTRIQETADAAVATTEQLEGHMAQVDGIGFEIRMIALNAIIKATHLGKTGSALEVVAQEVNTLSNQTNGFVARVKEVLNSVVKQVRELNGDALIEGKAAEEGETALAASISEVTGAYQRFRDASSDIVGRAGDLRKEIAETLSHLRFLPTLWGDLSVLQERMEKIADLLQPRIREDLRASVDEVNQLTERYTMHLERGIHRQLLGKGTGSSAPNAKSASETAPEAAPKKRKTPETDDLGDNVELF